MDRVLTEKEGLGRPRSLWISVSAEIRYFYKHGSRHSLISGKSECSTGKKIQEKKAAFPKDNTHGVDVIFS